MTKTTSLLPALISVGLLFASCCSAADRKAEPLSVKQREAILDEVWNLINTNYYDARFNGVDWRAAGAKYRAAVGEVTNDYEFHMQLRRMVAELHDSHSHYDLPPDMREPGTKPNAFNIGITVRPIEETLAVSGVDPKSDAAQQGTRVGMVVQSIDGQPAAEQLRHLRTRLQETESYSSTRVFNYLLHQIIFHGDAGSPAVVVLKDEAGNLKEIKVTRKDKLIAWNLPPTLAARRLPSGIGYIAFNHWSPTLKGQFRKELSKLMETPGLIVDVRGNNGGDIDFALEVAGHFFPDGTVLGHSIARDGSDSRWVSRENRPVYQGKVAVLVDAGSLSGSEFFASYMHDIGRAIVVGEQSAGAVLKQTGRKVTGGGLLHFSTHDFLSIKSRRVEGTGVTPDKVVSTTLADLRNGRDPVVDESVRILQAGAEGRPSL